MSTPRLHLLTHPSAREACFPEVLPGDWLLLADQGVLLLQGGHRWPEHIQLACLQADSTARGLPVPEGVHSLTDDAWVALVARHEQVLSWL